MSVKIRMRRMGKKKKPFYRIVAADSRKARDGRFIEMLGHYDPMTDPEDVKLDYDNIYKWLDRGAELSDNVSSLFRRVGVIERWRLLKEGVKITELDAVIKLRREKQPEKQVKTEKVKKAEAEPEESSPKEEVEETAKSEEAEANGKKVENEVKAEEVKKVEEKEEEKKEGKKEEKIEAEEADDNKSEIPDDSEKSSEDKDETKES